MEVIQGHDTSWISNVAWFETAWYVYPKRAPTEEEKDWLRTYLEPDMVVFCEVT